MFKVKLSNPHMCQIFIKKVGEESIMGKKLLRVQHITSLPYYPLSSLQEFTRYLGPRQNSYLEKSKHRSNKLRHESFFLFCFVFNQLPETG